MKNLEKLIARFGGTQPVSYVGERWGNQPFVDRLDNLLAAIQGMGLDYTDEDTSVIAGYDPGDAVLIENETGNAILRLAHEEDMES